LLTAGFVLEPKFYRKEFLAYRRYAIPLVGLHDMHGRSGVSNLRILDFGHIIVNALTCIILFFNNE